MLVTIGAQRVKAIIICRITLLEFQGTHALRTF